MKFGAIPTLDIGYSLLGVGDSSDPFFSPSPARHGQDAHTTIFRKTASIGRDARFACFAEMRVGEGAATKFYAGSDLFMRTSSIRPSGCSTTAEQVSTQSPVLKYSISPILRREAV